MKSVPRQGLNKGILGVIIVFATAQCHRSTEHSASAQTAQHVHTQSSGDAATGEASPEAQHREQAILAGGCFWGMEELLRKVPGVLQTEVGYTGGRTENPSYETVHDGSTGHAEAVRVTFDPTILSYEALLEQWFFRIHDPTTPNRQGNDRGSQYRSAIFTVSPAQRELAERVKARVQRSNHWPGTVVTEIVPAGPFTLAEDYHQDYLQRNPNGYTCHYLRHWDDT